MNECYREKIADLAQVRAGYPARGSLKPDSGGDVAIVQIRDFNEDRTTLDINGLMKFRPGREIKEDLVLKKGDILFLAKGAKNFAYALPDLPSVTVASGYFLTLRLTSDKALPLYLAWYLRQGFTISELRRFSGSGVHMPVVRRSTIENLMVSLPPRSIQEKIVELEGLMYQEQALLCALAEKRKQLVAAAIAPVLTAKRISL